MSKTLETIQNEVAAENGYKDWTWSIDVYIANKLWPIVCQRAQEEALKNASENLNTFNGSNNITDPSNIISGKTFFDEKEAMQRQIDDLLLNKTSYFNEREGLLKEIDRLKEENGKNEDKYKTRVDLISEENIRLRSDLISYSAEIASLKEKLKEAEELRLYVDRVNHENVDLKLSNENIKSKLDRYVELDRLDQNLRYKKD